MKMRPQPLQGSALIFGTIVLALGNFMIVLDTTIANVSLPTIAGDLGISSSEGIWIITSYAVAEAITVPLTGWLVQRFGQVRLFIASVVAFIIFSMACAMAWSLESLVIFRVLQGLTGGPIIPLSATLLVAIYPKEKRHIGMALWGMTTVLAPIGGPVLGGWLCDNYGWPWIFYINLPFGLAIALLGWRLLRGHDTPRRHTAIDVMGLILLVIFVSSLQLVLDKGRELDWFASSFIQICAIVAAVALILLVIWELTDENPVIDLSVFRSKTWLISTIILSLMFGLFFGNIVITPVWLQQQMGYTAFLSGLTTAPMGILAVITSPIVGRLLPKLDPRILITYGMVVLAGSFYLRALFTTEVDYWTIAVPMFILGAAMPACMITLTSLGISDLPPEKIAGGTGLQNFLRVMSMAIGGSLAQAYWEHASKFNRAELVAIADYEALVQTINPAADIFDGEASLQQFSRAVDAQAVMLATNDFYALSCLLMLGFAMLVWLIKPTAPLQAGGGGH